MGSGDPQSNRNSGKAGTASRSCRAAIGTHSQAGTARSERANLAFSPLLTPSRPDLLLLAPAGETPLLSAPGSSPAAGLATLLPSETGSSLVAGLPHWLGFQTASGAPVDPVNGAKPGAHFRQKLFRLQCLLREALAATPDFSRAPASRASSS